MKLSVLICVSCALFGALNAALIDRKSVVAAANPDGYVTKEFTFPSKPAFSIFEITKIVQKDNGAKPSSVKILNGGVGAGHVSMAFTSAHGQGIDTTFEIYAKPMSIRNPPRRDI